MKIIFDNEQQKTGLISSLCPDDVSLDNPITGNKCNGDHCRECLEKAVEMEIKEA